MVVPETPPNDRGQKERSRGIETDNEGKSGGRGGKIADDTRRVGKAGSEER